MKFAARLAGTAALVATTLSGAVCAQATDWPMRPVRIIGFCRDKPVLVV